MNTEIDARWWIWAVAAVAIWGLCLVACAGLGVVLARQVRDRSAVSTQTATLTAVARQGTHTPRATTRTTAKPSSTPSPPLRATPTPRGTASRVPTRTPTPTRSPVRERTPTPTSTPTRSPTRERTPTPTQTPYTRPTHTPTSTPRPTRQPTRAPTPTPIVCDDLDQLRRLTIVPGQRFTCTIHEDDLTKQINQQPDVPCRDVNIAFADDEVQLTCRMGIKLNAVGVVKTENCRMSIQIVRGTIGFTQVVQELLNKNAQFVPFDAICVEAATVGDGEIEIRGYGR